MGKYGDFAKYALPPLIKGSDQTLLPSRTKTNALSYSCLLYTSKWINTYGFSQEMIILACDKTIGITHNPSFEYADRILSSWKKSGVATPADVEKYDLEHQMKVNKKKAEGTKAQKPSNQFHNFEQRSRCV